MATCYSSFDLCPPRHCTPAPHKDYSRPLHVDCSVEYELPNQAKPPEGARSEPLLMIHPCYYRRAESQRRSPFINNLPTPRGVVTTSRRSQASQVRLVSQQQQQQQQHYQVRYVEATNHQPSWNQQHLEPPSVYSKPVGGKPGKRDPLLCGGGDFSSGSDSGVSAGHWTDSDRSPLAPEVRLHRDFHNNNHPGGGGGGTDSGIATPVSLADDKTVLSGMLANFVPVKTSYSRCKKLVSSELMVTTCGAMEVNNNNKDLVAQQQPAVGVAAVAPTCASCRPGFLPTPQSAYQRILQQPWAGMTTASQYQQPALASTGSKHRSGGAVRAVEPGPEHAASSLHHVHVRRSVPWARTTSTGAVKRSRTSHNQESTTWMVQAHYPAETSSRTTWNQTNTKDTVCKACYHPPQTTVAPAVPDTQPQPPPQPQQPQWGTYYGVTGHCRGASEEGSRILWNNENMLRLFQV